MIIPDKTVKGTLPDDELDVLLKFIERNKWRHAFSKLDLPTLKSKERWFTDKKRGTFYSQLDTSKGRVLDVGPGAGVISEALSESFKHVYSLEYNHKWVQFLAKRFAQDDNNNIDVLRGNAIHFPFKQNCFDLVVVNGVLEWVADFSPEGSTEEVQLNFLKNIFKLIRPKGKIGIAIENRYYLRHFLGESPHGEPPYVVLMPRFLANYISQKRQNKQYRNYIYSYWGYKHLLKRAGFKNIKVELAVPNYYHPRFIVNLRKRVLKDHLNDLSIYKSQNTLLRKITSVLLGLGLLGYLEHSFYISGEK